MTKLTLRRAWFQVHKWIGLILAILIIPLCLTGSALVWDEALDHVLNPQRHAVSGAQRLPAGRYVAAARAVLQPGQRLLQLSLPDGDGPVQVQATVASATPRPGPPQRTTVYLDPPTARVLEVQNGAGGLIRGMHMIHGSLMVPGVGRTIVGWIGVAMLLSSISGLWLWWPVTGSVRRGFRWKRHRNLDTNLHHQFGFWIALPLFVLSLTGAWIAFPAFFGALTGGVGGRGGEERARAFRAQPLATPQLDVGAVLAAARSPGDIARISWPTDLKPRWTLTPADAAQSSIEVADAGGAITRQPPPREDLGRFMRRLHDGTRMGWLWQLIIFIGGILPAALAVTGVIMWWRARGWKADLAARQAAIRAAD